MCTGKCAKIIGKLLFPLGILAIVANLLLYFPNGNILEVDQITDYVWFFHGIVGAGLLVFLPAFMMIGAGGEGCCANRCGMFLSVILSALGTVGAVYCVIISAMGLIHGPRCDTGDGEYTYPFRNDTDEENYLFNQDRWSICKTPENVVLWNVVLFSITLGISAIEAILCLIQVINGLIGVICGTCLRKRKVEVKMSSIFRTPSSPSHLPVSATCHHCRSPQRSSIPNYLVMG
ncbi:PREDICTED: transmembrane 4 L6 family member 1-like [Nanorana parkeri]|uniref:transmembrane 4 L6 family member 1-like n=1 Tax=Nanorana parkeri TaxID=125878 RepID=UPI0008546B15|nr:PREDICTED: transmembrane 4 L6 family member 1-like [Nanorana parkeri]